MARDSRSKMILQYTFCATDFYVLKEIALRLLLGHVLGPAAPGGGELRHREQLRDLAAVARIDAKDVSDRHGVRRLLQDADRVAHAELALADDAEVGAGAKRLGEAPDEMLIVHARAQAPARDARLGDFQNDAADLPALADERGVDVDPLGREVLAEAAVGNRTRFLALPPAQVFERVGVDRLVIPAVRLAVGLVVAGEVDAARRDAALDGRFPDRALDRLAVELEGARPADVDRDDSCGGIGNHLEILRGRRRSSEAGSD